MSSSNDELRDYLISRGLSRADVLAMSEQELIETVSVILDSDNLDNKSQPEVQYNLKKNQTNNYSKPSKERPVFNKKYENAGLTDEEACRVAMQESMNSFQPGTQNMANHSNLHKNSNSNNSNSRNSSGRLGESILDFANSAYQSFRDMIHSGELFFSQQQNQFGIDLSDDEFNNKYEPPPPQSAQKRTQHSSQNFYFQNQNNYQPPPKPPNIYSQHKNQNDDDFSYYHDYNQDNHPYNNPMNDIEESPIPNYDDFIFSSDDEKPDNDNDDDDDDLNSSRKIIQRQNEEIKRLEEEVAQKEREENEKKLLQEEENNVKEACQVSLADEIVELLVEAPDEPDEPKTPSEKKKVVSLQVIMDSNKKIERRFNDTDKGIYVYAWVAGTTLDSDEKLYMNTFELKMPMGKVLDKKLTLGEQNVFGKVRFIVSEIDLQSIDSQSIDQ